MPGLRLSKGLRAPTIRRPPVPPTRPPSTAPAGFPKRHARAAPPASAAVPACPLRAPHAASPRHCRAYGIPLFRAQPRGRRRENRAFLNFNVSPIQLHNFACCRFEPLGVRHRETPLGQPQLSQPFHLGMQRIGALMFGFKRIYLRQNSRRISALPHSRKQRFLFIRRMLGRSLAEVSESSFYRAPLVLAQRSPAARRHATQHSGKLFDSPVAIAKHSDRVVESTLRLSTNSNRHPACILSYSIKVVSLPHLPPCARARVLAVVAR